MSKFGFQKVRENMQRIRTELPLILANEAKNDFLNNFAQQGFDSRKWDEVERRKPGTPAYLYPKTKDLSRRTRNILQGQGSGRLRKDVANSVQAGYPIKDGYVGVVKNPYGGFHNAGATLKNGGTLPQRQFVGFTRPLREKMYTKARKFYDSIWLT